MAVGRRSDLALGVEAEGGGNVVPALKAVFGGLGVGKLDPLEQIAQDGRVAGTGGFKPGSYSAGNYFRLVESPFEFFAPMEGDGDYVVKSRYIGCGGNLFPKHPGKVYPYGHVAFVFEHVNRFAVVVGVVEKGIDALYRAAAPEDLLGGVVLHAPEVGEGEVCVAFKAKMLLVIIQLNTTNRATLWKAKVKQQSPPLHLHRPAFCTNLAKICIICIEY